MRGDKSYDLYHRVKGADYSSANPADRPCYHSMQMRDCLAYREGRCRCPSPRGCTSLDENGYICEKDAAIKAIRAALDAGPIARFGEMLK